MSKYHNAFQGFVKVFTGAKQPGVKGSSTTIIGTKPNVGNLKKNQETINKFKKTTDKYVTAAKEKGFKDLAKDLRKSGSKSLQKTDKILRKNKKDGGRMGLKDGMGPAGSAKISDKADRAKKAFDMFETNLNTDFKTMNRTQDSKGRFKDRKSMRKYIDDLSAASTRDSAKVRIDRKLGGGTNMAKRKTNVQKIKETFAPKKPENVPSKFKGFSKLPEAVQQKMNKKLAKKV